MRSHKKAWIWLLLAAGLAAGAPAGLAQNSLAGRTLVVYAVNDPDSQAIAAYYQARRGIPEINLCPIWLPDINATSLNAGDYQASIRGPIQTCLNNTGRENILYIVLAYLRPFGLNIGAGLDYYALDSFLADVWDEYTTQTFDPYPTRAHPYYVNNQSQGNSFTPFQSLAAYRGAGSLPLIYSVWRLDGETPALAQALIDNALAAEASGGPITQDPAGPALACVDLLVDPNGWADSSYRAGDWDLYRAAQFLDSSRYFHMVLETTDAVFGQAPAPDCRNGGLYAGWYNYSRYVDAFSWTPGSIGWDLDSSALADPRSGPFWSANALQHGLTVTSGPMTEPYLEGMARPGGVVRNLLEGANVGDAFLRNTRWLKWRILNVGDPLYTPFLYRSPFLAGTGSTTSLGLSAREIVGGDSVLVTVALADPAPGEGAVVYLASNNGAVALPESVTVEAGSMTTSFLVRTAAVATSTEVWLTASSATGSVNNTMVLDPMLFGAEFDSDRVQGGATATATVYLNASAPLGGAVVSLASDRPDIVGLPSSVFVAAGLSSVAFAFSTAPVGDNTTVNITASYAGAAPVATLTITP